MTKQERLHNMFATAVLRKLINLKCKGERGHILFKTVLTDYIVDSALDLQLIEYDEHTDCFKLKNRQI